MSPRTLHAAAKAAAQWHPVPDWVAALASACDASGLRATAARLGVSPALVSLTIGNQQRSTEMIEPRVRSRIMAPMRACPELGLIEEAACLHQQAQPLVTSNPARLALYRACRGGCPFYAPPKGQGGQKAKETPHVA